jgi:hypothetical protein
MMRRKQEQAARNPTDRESREADQRQARQTPGPVRGQMNERAEGRGMN